MALLRVGEGVEGRKSLVMLTALTAGLAACTTVGPNFVPPEPPAVSAYAMPGDATPLAATLDPKTRVAGPWWRAFGSDHLNALMDQALAGNLSVAAALAKLDAARAAQTVEGADRLPRVDAKAGAERERFNTAAFGFASFPSPTINLFTLGQTVSYDLDLFGGQRRRSEAAAARFEAEGRRADGAYMILTARVAAQAAQIAGLEARLAVDQDILADDQKLIDIQNAAIAVGGTPASSNINRRQQLAEDQALAEPVRQQIAQARHALALLVGQPPAAWTAPDFALSEFATPTSAPQEIPSAWIRHRPDVAAAEADLHAATARIGVATADLYPSFRLSAGFSQLATTPANLFGYSASAWNFGAGASAPVFHGGALRAGKRAAEAEARLAMGQYQQTVLTALTQAADVMTNLAHDEARLKDLNAAEASAKSNLAHEQSAYNLGGDPLIAVIEAKRRLDVTKVGRTTAEGARLADLIELYAVSATDWRDPVAAKPAAPQ